MPRNPNPQGKGLVPVLQGIQQHWAQPVLLPKQIDQIEMELFTSLFVLQSEFKFNPVPGKSYWMYTTDHGYRLLLVAPHEWHTPYNGHFIGECVLQKDRTWTLVLNPELSADAAFMRTVDALRGNLLSALEKAEKIEDILPGFEESLGYYGRITAFILGKSLLASMQLSGINALDYKAAKGLLESKGSE
ncbi:MAG: hypothetical protein RLZZ227_68 [Pseudomonadota bacterium]|jgi:hypothetical protein